jgi:Na+(H+)/acetate symporter ActP
MDTVHRLLLTTLPLFLLLNAGAASAQEVRGTVSDVTEGEPLAGALLALVDGDSLVRATAISDDAGTFLLRPPAGDSLRLRVQRIGYAALESVPISLGWRLPTLRVSRRIHR